MTSKQLKIITVIMVIVSSIFIEFSVKNVDDGKVQKGNNSNEKLLAMNYIFDDTIAELAYAKQIVYETYTLDDLAARLDTLLADDLSGKGYLIASYSLDKGVDPYLAASIMMHETGCTWGCSRLVKECNNVGGQKGTGCGSYKYYNTLDEGIMGMIDNLYNKYISLGLTTPEAMNFKYAEDTKWSYYVNKYIEQFRSI